ncbi:uncharacterized protein B4U79_07607, partial [Dinothrombium tinctorium]
MIKQNLEESIGWDYHQKMCLSGTNPNVCSFHWSFEKVLSSQLFGLDSKHLNDVFTEEQCIEACLSERSFLCSSVRYDVVNKSCALSKYDRRSSPEAFKRISQFHVVYLENQCAQETRRCNFHLVRKSYHQQLTASHVYLISGANSRDECEKMCANNVDFNCRSFVYDSSLSSCSQSPQDSLSFEHIESAIKLISSAKSPLTNNRNQNSSYYYEKRCNEECDKNDVHFELLSGVLFVSSPYKTTRDFQPQNCLKVCRQELACRSVNIDYKKNVCEFHGHDSRSAVNFGKYLKENPFFNHFRKICLKSGNSCARDWAFERVRGRELVSVAFGKVSVDSTSLEECEAACLNFKPFICRSAEFNHQLNECKLSPFNRYASSEKHAKLGVRSNTDYLENNCVQEAKTFCNWKSLKQHRLILADRFLFTEDMERCEEECANNRHFICRSFTYEVGTKTCALSHHSKRSFPQGALLRSPSHIFNEISTCFDVAVDCEPEVMKARILSSTLFQGKVYARDRPNSCALDVGNSMQFELSILLAGDECATVSENQEIEVHAISASVFSHEHEHHFVHLSSEEGKFSNVLVIQSNDRVVTAFDKAIGVKCNYDVGNRTGETALHINELRLSDRLRASPELPELSLHIMDSSGYEREVVNLGELLRVQVRMSDEDTYGIFVRNMIAKDGMGSNNITLIDHAGCPVEAKMMREVRTIDQQSKSLESYFEAFSFTGSSTLELEAEVETCLDKCKPVHCRLATGRSDDEYETVPSFGRRRRREVNLDTVEKGDVLETTKLSKALVVRSQQFGLGVNTASKVNNNLKSVQRPITAPLHKIKSTSFADHSQDESGP